VQVNRAILIIIGCLFTSVVMAEDKSAPPSDKLLDFLGQWERVDGQWVDPTEVQELSMLEGKQLNGEDDER